MGRRTGDSNATGPSRGPEGEIPGSVASHATRFRRAGMHASPGSSKNGGAWTPESRATLGPLSSPAEGGTGLWPNPPDA
jgi:hypothetical protein